MRVEYNTVDEFLSDLESEKDSIWDSTVRLRINKTSMNDEGTSYQISMWLTAVVRKETGEFVMELGAVAGEDIEDSNPDRSGSERADEWKEKVYNVTEDLGLRIKPGKYELI